MESKYIHITDTILYGKKKHIFKLCVKKYDKKHNCMPSFYVWKQTKSTAHFPIFFNHFSFCGYPTLIFSLQNTTFYLKKKDLRTTKKVLRMDQISLC